MTKELTAKDVECFNELNRLNAISRNGFRGGKIPSWYFRRRKDEIFEKSDYTSPLDFWNDYIEWNRKGEQLTLL